MGRVVIGLVGGIASGKSTVASLMADLGARVYDADEDCHRLLERDDIASRVVEVLGESVMSDGRLDRAEIAKLVFSSTGALSSLESILHGEVDVHLRASIDSLEDGGVLVVDAPLLLEASLDGSCDLIAHVEADPDLRHWRMAERGWDDADMSRREERQLPLDSKRAKADVIIDNSGDLTGTRALVELFWREDVEPRRNR